MIKPFLYTIAQWQTSRWTWFIMLMTALSLETCALAFQYVYDMTPCERCVYQRFAVFLLMLAALIIMAAPNKFWPRVTGYSVWIFASIYGLKTAIRQMADYGPFNPFSNGCSFFPTFPLKLPLDHWFPSVFKPTGSCGADGWLFLDLNMAQWMTGIFSIYVVAVVVCVVSFVYIRFTRNS